MENMNRINVLDRGFIELLESMGSDATIAESARISHFGKSTGDESDKKLINSLLSHAPRHTSPFEQVELRFLVKAPIFVARQWMRHRTWSYSEVSRRYTSKDIDFYIPEFEHSAYRNIYEKAIAESISSYNNLIALGTRKEIARGILPFCMYTTFYAKTDLNNLLHFLELRRSPDAQYEIRVYADAIEKFLEERFPITYDAWNNSLTN